MWLPNRKVCSETISTVNISTKHMHQRCLNTDFRNCISQPSSLEAHLFMTQLKEMNMMSNVLEVQTNFSMICWNQRLMGMSVILIEYWMEIIKSRCGTEMSRFHRSEEGLDSKLRLMKVQDFKFAMYTYK